MPLHTVPLAPTSLQAGMRPIMGRVSQKCVDPQSCVPNVPFHTRTAVRALAEPASPLVGDQAAAPMSWPTLTACRASPAPRTRCAWSRRRGRTCCRSGCPLTAQRAGWHRGRCVPSPGPTTSGTAPPPHTHDALRLRYDDRHFEQSKKLQENLRMNETRREDTRLGNAARHMERSRLKKVFIAQHSKSVHLGDERLFA